MKERQNNAKKPGTRLRHVNKPYPATTILGIYKLHFYRYFFVFLHSHIKETLPVSFSLKMTTSPIFTLPTQADNFRQQMKSVSLAF